MIWVPVSLALCLEIFPTFQLWALAEASLFRPATTVTPVEVAPSESVRVFVLCKKEAEAFHPREGEACVVNVAAGNGCKQGINLGPTSLPSPTFTPCRGRATGGQVSLDPKT